jgi:hypothetical protein
MIYSNFLMEFLNSNMEKKRFYQQSAEFRRVWKYSSEKLSPTVFYEPIVATYIRLFVLVNKNYFSNN